MAEALAEESLLDEQVEQGTCKQCGNPGELSDVKVWDRGLLCTECAIKTYESFLRMILEEDE